MPLYSQMIVIAENNYFHEYSKGKIGIKLTVLSTGYRFTVRNYSELWPAPLYFSFHAH